MFNFHESNVIMQKKKKKTLNSPKNILHFLVLESFCEIHPSSETGDLFYRLLNGLNAVVRHSNICNLRQCEQGTQVSPKKYSMSLLNWKHLRRIANKHSLLGN